MTALRALWDLLASRIPDALGQRIDYACRSWGSDDGCEYCGVPRDAAGKCGWCG